MFRSLLAIGSAIVLVLACFGDLSLHENRALADDGCEDSSGCTKSSEDCAERPENVATDRQIGLEVEPSGSADAPEGTVNDDRIQVAMNSELSLYVNFTTVRNLRLPEDLDYGGGPTVETNDDGVLQGASVFDNTVTVTTGGEGSTSLTVRWGQWEKTVEIDVIEPTRWYYLLDYGQYPTAAEDLENTVLNCRKSGSNLDLDAIAIEAGSTVTLNEFQAFNGDEKIYGVPTVPLTVDGGSQPWAYEEEIAVGNGVNITIPEEAAGQTLRFAFPGSSKPTFFDVYEEATSLGAVVSVLGRTTCIETGLDDDATPTCEVSNRTVAFGSGAEGCSASEACSTVIEFAPLVGEKCAIPRSTLCEATVTITPTSEEASASVTSICLDGNELRCTFEQPCEFGAQDRFELRFQTEGTFDIRIEKGEVATQFELTNE